MAINYKEIFQTASFCLTEDTESGFRSAISRSYYSAYHCVLSHLQHYKYPEKTPTHKALTDYLANPNSKELINKKTLAKIKNQLLLLKKARTRSDYELEQNVFKLDATQQLLSAKRIIESIEATSPLHSLQK